MGAWNLFGLIARVFLKFHVFTSFLLEGAGGDVAILVPIDNVVADGNPPTSLMGGPRGPPVNMTGGPPAYSGGPPGGSYRMIVRKRNL